MKKEHIILGLIVVALSAYIVIHKKDRNNYTLPLIPKVNVADITEIILEKNINAKDGKNIVISKKDGGWLVRNSENSDSSQSNRNSSQSNNDSSQSNKDSSQSNKDYPANQESITQMLDVIKDLTLSALVSESGNLTPYELDVKNRINVTVKSKVETLRKFQIGKTAPSFRHTFIKLDGNNSVYHAAKNFRRDFDKTIDNLRDKKVLSFDKNKITNITLKKGDLIKEVVIKNGKLVVDAKDNKSTVDNKNDKSIAKTNVVDIKDSSAADNKGVNGVNNITNNKESEAIESILNTLSDFKCHSFTDTDNKDEFKDKGIEEIAKIILKVAKEKGDQEYSLVLYKKDSKENYPSLSSESIYPFMLDTYQGNDLVAKIDDVISTVSDIKVSDVKVSDVKVSDVKVSDVKEQNSGTDVDSNREKK